MDELRPNKWAAGTVKLTILSVLVWACVALVGRARGDNPYAERNTLVTVLLVSCLFSGVGLLIAVPIMGAISIARDSIAGKSASFAAIFVEMIIVFLSIWYIFPYGLGK
jgi:hypothetical protein